MTKTMTIDELESFEALEDTIRDDVDCLIDDACEVENDGIGAYEFWGQKCYDKGTDYITFNGLELVYDVTALQLSDEDKENLPIASGIAHVALGDEYNEVESDIHWTAKGKVFVEGDKTFLLYSVTD